MAKVINTKDKVDDASNAVLSADSKVYKPLQASCPPSPPPTHQKKNIQTIKKQFQAIQVLFFLKKKSIEPYKLVQEHSFCASQEIRLLWEH